MSPRSVDDYLNLPYTIEVMRDESDDYIGWFARVIELPGCMTQADTFEELGEMVEDAMRAWIETALEDGQPIPEPRPLESYSGKFVVRIPRSLHRQLAEAAERNEVSLNTFVNVALGQVVSFQPISSSDPQPEATPGPTWSRLSDAARRALLAAGLQVEAQEVDERLFAGWLEGNVRQVQAAVEGGYIRDAIWHLDQVRQALGLCGEASPLMKVFYQAIHLLKAQIELASQLREGLVQQGLIQARIKTQVQTASQHLLYESHRQSEYELMTERDLVARKESAFDSLLERDV